MIENKISDSVLHLRIDDSARGNAISREMLQSLSAAVKDVQKSKKIEGLILSGGPRLFCAGGDLKFFAKQKTAAPGLKLNSQIAQLLGQIEKLRVPTLALIEGDCIGGGIELLSAFDYAICTPNAFFAFWQSRLALSFGWGGATRLSRRLSEHQIQTLMRKSEIVSAYRAHELGLVDEVAGFNEIHARAELAMSRFLKVSPAARAALKGFKPANEKSLFTKLWWTPEHKAKLKI